MKRSVTWQVYKELSEAVQWYRQRTITWDWAEREVLGCRDGEDELDSGEREEDKQGLESGGLGATSSSGLRFLGSSSSTT